MATIQHSAQSAQRFVQKLFTSWIRRRLVSRDSIVDVDWLRYLLCCQPASDVAENLGRLRRPLPCKMFVLNLKNGHAPELSVRNSHAKLSHSKQLLKNIYPMNDVCTICTARRYASAVYAVVVCLSIRLSVTSRHCTKTAKRRITETTSHDSIGTLVFCCQKSRRNSNGVIPYEDTRWRWG